MNININDFMANLMKSMNTDFETFDYKKMMDEALKSGSVFDNYNNGNSLNQMSIFNFEIQGQSQNSFTLSKFQQSKTKSFEQYSQQATQLLTAMDEAYKKWENTIDSNGYHEDQLAIAEAEANIVARNFAIELESVAESATGEEKNKLLELVSQINAKCDANSAKKLSLIEDDCNNINESMVTIRNPDAVVAETQFATTDEQIREAIRKLENTKASYIEEYQRAKSLMRAHDADGGAKKFIDEAIAKLDARINQLKPKEKDKTNDEQ